MCIYLSSQSYSCGHDSAFDGGRKLRLWPVPLGRVLVAPQVVERDTLFGL